LRNAFPVRGLALKDRQQKPRELERFPTIEWPVPAGQFEELR
jgi:hypothetical protein